MKRNVSHYKKFVFSCLVLEQEESELEDEIVENDNELEYEENNENGHTNESDPEQRVNRWPKRTRRPTVRFGHSVPSNLIP